METTQQNFCGDVMLWLKYQLRSLYPRWHVQVFYTSTSNLSAFLRGQRLQGAFPAYETLAFRVSITAVLRHGKKTQLVLAECKTAPITLKDIGPLLGYSRLTSPALAVLLSPAGLSKGLNLLLKTYNRVDVMEYGAGKRLKVATWDAIRKQVDPVSVFPPGELG